MGRPKIGAIIALDGEKEFKQAVTGVNSELRKLKSESNLIEEQFKGQSNTLEALRAKHENLTKTLETQKQKEAELEKALNNAKKARESVSNGLQELRKKYEEAVQKMEEMKNSSETSDDELKKQKDLIKELAETIERGERNYETASNRIKNWETSLNHAQAQTLRANKALEENARYLEEADNSTDGCAQSIDEFGRAVQQAEESTTSWGSAVQVAVANKVVSAVGDAAKAMTKATVGTAEELNASANQLQASTGTAASAMGKYRDVMEEVYKKNYGENLEDVGNAVGVINQNLGDLDASSLQGATENMIALRDTFDFDYQEQTRAVKMIMDTWGVSSERAYNLIAQGAQNGLNKNGDLLDVINEYAVHYKQMGVGAEEFFNSLANGTEAGTFSVDKLGDAYKEFGIRVKDTAATTTEGFGILGMNADEMRTKFAAGGESAKAATDEVLTALFNMDDKVKQNQAGVDLFGTMWEDLGIEGVKALMNLNGEIDGTRDALSQIKDVKYDDVTNSITRISRTVQMKIAEPIAENILPKVADGLDVVGDHLEETSVAVLGLGSMIAVYKTTNSEVFKSVVSSIKNAVEATKNLEEATEGATMAQKAFAAVKSLSTTGKIVGAIGLATAGLVAYIAKTREAKDSTAQFIKETQEQQKEWDSNIEKIGEHTTSVETEWGANAKLLEKLKELNKVDDESIGRREMMKNIVNELSDDIPELAQKFDEETGSLKMTDEEMDKLYQTHKEYAMYLAHQDMFKEYCSQLAEVEIRMEETKDKMKELTDKYGDFDLTNSAWDGSAKAKAEYKELKEQQEELGKQQDKLNGKIKSTEKGIEEYGEASKEASAAVAEYTAAVEESGGTVENVTTEQAEAFQSMKESLGESIESSISLFEEFDGGTEISLENIQKNLESQKEGLTNWKNNMIKLSEAAGQGMTTELYQELSQMGPQGANAVQALVDALEESPERFQEVCQLWMDTLGLEEAFPEEIAAAGEKTRGAVNEESEKTKPVMAAVGAFAGEAYASGLNSKKGEVKAASQSVYDISKSPYQNSLAEFSNIGLSLAQGLAVGIRRGEQEAAAASAGLVGAALLSAQSTGKIHSPSHLFRDEIGIMLSKGMAVGITKGSGEACKSVADVCQAVLTAAQTELDIHSPSKKFQNTVGAQISKGVAFGIRAKKGTAIKESKSLADDVYRAASKWLSNYKKTHTTSLEDEKYFWKKVASTTKKGTKSYKEALQKATNIDAFEKKVNTKVKNAFNVSRYTTGSNGEKQKKSVSDYYNEIYSKANTYMENQKVLHNISLQKEEYYWKQVRKKLKKGTQAYVDATKKIKDIQEERKAQTAAEKEEYKSYALSGGALDAYKTYYKVSAKAEVQYWDTVRKKFKAGTAERLEADQKYYEAKESLNEQLEELNEEYYENCKETNEKLAEDIQELTDEYNDAVQERKDAIYSSFNLFDEFESTSVSGGTLLYNLKTQVVGYADWEQQLEKLGSKNILSSELMQELREMGPEASASIHALNQLSSEQLREYENLYEQKKALAESQAVKENETLKKETEKKIQELKNAAQQELDAYKSEYTKAIVELNKSIEKPLKDIANKATKVGEDTVLNMIKAIKKGATKKSTKADLKAVNATVTKTLGTLPSAGKTIGNDTLQGIIDGLTNKKKINKSAQEMVDSLRKAIQKAADIHSPSRLFKKEIGVQLSAGVAEGMEDNQRNVNTAGENMIKDLTKRSKEQIARQQEELKIRAAEITSNVGLAELNSLISVAPVQQRVEVVADNSDLCTMFLEMMEVMEKGFEQMGNMQLITDTGAIIGETSAGMSNAFAMQNRRLRR